MVRWRLPLKTVFMILFLILVSYLPSSFNHLLVNVFLGNDFKSFIISQKGSHLMPPRELPFYELVEPLNNLFQQAETV